MTFLTNVEVLEWKGRWRRNVYVMYRRFAVGSGAEERVYGPLVEMGDVRMPSWGARIDGSYRFRDVSVIPTETSPDVAFDPPRRSAIPRPNPFAAHFTLDTVARLRIRPYPAARSTPLGGVAAVLPEGGGALTSKGGNAVTPFANRQHPPTSKHSDA